MWRNRLKIQIIYLNPKAQNNEYSKYVKMWRNRLKIQIYRYTF
jgi:hypothetical protein